MADEIPKAVRQLKSVLFGEKSFSVKTTGNEGIS
jgi:hypothetical protein